MGSFEKKNDAKSQERDNLDIENLEASDEI